jgi:hypothetical protein
LKLCAIQWKARLGGSMVHISLQVFTNLHFFEEAKPARRTLGIEALSISMCR